MMKRLRRKMQKARPERGDEIMIYDADAGDWINAMVQGHGTADGDPAMLVIAPGHSRSYAVAIPVEAHGKWWRWMHEVKHTSSTPLSAASAAAIAEDVASKLKRQEARDASE